MHSGLDDHLKWQSSFMGSYPSGRLNNLYMIKCNQKSLFSKRKSQECLHF